LFFWGNGQVKGIVFNRLEEVVRSGHVEDAWDTIRTGVPVPQVA
jgi:hypothetical protein